MLTAIILIVIYNYFFYYKKKIGMYDTILTVLEYLVIFSDRKFVYYFIEIYSMQKIFANRETIIKCVTLAMSISFVFLVSRLLTLEWQCFY